MTKLTLFVISDNEQEPCSYLTTKETWDDFGKDTQFFSKKAYAAEMLNEAFFKVSTMRIKSITLTVD